ncbi:DNA repair RAD50 [Fusarium albosuccineum]|uniref:Efflux pump dotC n=1 Tax=Fusarium albosuccineum TaxID=1237068 RepID=A0A8H4PBN9_9HYPO|nr:DNA repair RAD50 [Fusarium albosuccineum]
MGGTSTIETPDRGSSDIALDIERDGAPSHGGSVPSPDMLPSPAGFAPAPAPTPTGASPSLATPNNEEPETRRTRLETTPNNEEPEAGRTKLETTLVMLALGLALFLAALDMTIITTAIATISSDLKSSQGYIWIGSAYMLANAAFALTWGKVSDIFGRKPIILLAGVIFFVGSLLCGLSKSMPMLIAARAIQGIGGGGLIVLPNICISDLFSMRNRGLYFGLLGGVWSISSAVGPLLGGAITSKATWRWCFYLNLPLTGVVIIILIFVLKLHNPKTPMKEGLLAIDWSGSVLIMGGTIMLLLGLELGGVVYPWRSSTTICLIVFGVLTIGAFLGYEARVARYPLAPARLFDKSNSKAAYGLGFTHAFVFMSGSYWLPLYFQGVLGVGPLLSGVYLLPFVLALSLVSMAVGIMIKKTGRYKIIIVAGFALFTNLEPRANWAKIIVYQIVAGVGIGPNFQAPLIALQTNIDGRDIGSATSMFSFIRQIGTSISVVIGGVMLNNGMERQHSKLERELGPDLADSLSGANAAANVQFVGSLTGEEGRIAKAAYWKSLQTMYIVYTCFAGLALIISMFIQQINLNKEHKEHKPGLASLRARKDDRPARENEKATDN